MISRLSKLFVALLIGAVCIYFVTLNQQRVAVSIADGNTVESSAGVVVLFSFALGLLCASLAGSIFAVRGFFREQAQKRQLRMREIRENAILDTRALAASGDLAAAQAGWTKLVGRYPEDPILRIELASSLERAGHTLGAVRVLDEARLKFPENQEIMYRAADVNERAGNLTASIDNLALLVSRRPSSQAIRKARELSLRLDRLEDAREYNDRLREFEGNSADVSAFEGEITARILVRDYKDRPEELSKKLLQHVLNHECRQ